MCYAVQHTERDKDLPRLVADRCSLLLGNDLRSVCISPILTFDRVIKFISKFGKLKFDHPAGSWYLGTFHSYLTYYYINGWSGLCGIHTRYPGLESDTFYS